MNEFVSKSFESKITSKIELAKKSLKEMVKEVNAVDFELHDLPETIKPRRIAALDGGGFSQDLVGVTIVPSRAAGAIFERDKDPYWIEKTDIDILTTEEDPKNFGSLLRDKLEIEVALELLEHKPNILFLDGSITNYAYKGVPRSLQFYFEDKESDSIVSRFHDLFIQFIKLAYKLITRSIELDVTLVGISKDSRTNLLVNHVYKNKKTPKISDTTFVRIKGRGQTGFTAPIVFTPEIRDIRKKTWKAAEVFTEKELQSYYLSYFILKEGAIPIRVDSLLPQKEKLKEIQEALVTYHDGNGFITPAYLTHKRAHMNQDLGNRLVNLISGEIFDDDPEVFLAFLAKRRRDIIQ